jgi:hypothetical protein
MPPALPGEELILSGEPEARPAAAPKKSPSGSGQSAPR